MLNLRPDPNRQAGERVTLCPGFDHADSGQIELADIHISRKLQPASLQHRLAERDCRIHALRHSLIIIDLAEILYRRRLRITVVVRLFVSTGVEVGNHLRHLSGRGGSHDGNQ